MYGSPLSSEIYQFAEANRLGDPIASYKMHPRIIRRYSGPLHMTIALFGFGLFALVSAIYLCTQAFTPTATWDDVHSLAALPLFSTLAFLAFLGYHLDITYQKTSLTVCERGLLGYNESTRDVTAIPWDTIESVWCEIARVYSSDAGDKRRRYGWKYAFQCNDVRGSPSQVMKARSPSVMSSIKRSTLACYPEPSPPTMLAELSPSALSRSARRVCRLVIRPFPGKISSPSKWRASKLSCACLTGNTG